MSRNILVEALARTIAGIFGAWLAPLTSRIPWPLRLGCGCLLTIGFLGVLLVLALLVGGG